MRAPGPLSIRPSMSCVVCRAAAVERQRHRRPAHDVDAGPGFLPFQSFRQFVQQLDQLVLSQGPIHVSRLPDRRVRVGPARPRAGRMRVARMPMRWTRYLASTPAPRSRSGTAPARPSSSAPGVRAARRCAPPSLPATRPNVCPSAPVRFPSPASALFSSTRETALAGRG